MPAGLWIGLWVGLLGLTVLAFYYKLWLPDLILVKRDATMTLLPLKQYAAERLSSGHLPQWFPYDALGRPFLGAAAGAGVFHPFTLLFFLLPAHDAYRVSILLSCLLAAYGAFVLGRRLNLSGAGSMLAGIVFGCSGYVASMTENIQYLYPICLLPLFLTALEKALNAHYGWAVAPAALWATVFLNGDIQTGYYYCFVALLWAVMRAAVPVAATAGRLALITGLTALLAGIQLGPLFSLFLESNRRNPTLFLEQEALTWSIHPLRLLTTVVWPNSEQSNPGEVMRVFFGGPAKPPLIESLYLGIPALGLACLGMTQRRDLRVLTVLGALTLLLSLGQYGGLYNVFLHIVPFWSAFRYPEKITGFFFLSVGMLAGSGMDRLREGRLSQGPWLITACVCLATSLILTSATGQTLVAVLHETSMHMARDVAGTSARSLLLSSLAALGIGLLIMAAQQQWIRRRVLIGSVVTIVTITLASTNMSAYKTGPSIVYTFTPPLLNSLRAEEGGSLSLGRFRVAEPHFHHGGHWPLHLEEELGYYGAASVFYRQAFNGGLMTEFGVEGFRVTLPGISPQLEAVRAANLSHEVYARFNVAYFILRQSLVKDRSLLDGLVGELPDFDLALYRNPVPAKPRVYLSRKPEVAAPPPTPEALFKRPDFLSGELDVIETSDSLPGPARAGTAAIERYEPERVVLRTASAAPAVLVLVDAFDPGWRATLETGEALPVRRANLVMRAVVVPAGEHRVTFTYRTPLLEAGAGASATGLALCLALLASARRRKQPDEPKEPEDVSTAAG